MEGTSSTLGVAAGPTPTRPESTPLTVGATAPVVAAAAWPRSAQGATAALLALALGLLGWQAWHAQRWAARPTDLDMDAPGRIDLNHADHAQLRELPGVGETTAARIEEYRAAHGGFQSVDELRKLHGIGPALLERLRPLVEVEPLDAGADENDGPPAAPPEVQKETPAKIAAPALNKPIGGKKKGEDLPGLIDLNRATAVELQRLPGIGPALSGRILQVRDRQPFRSVEELRRVPGIGPKTLEHLRPFVVVNDGQAQP